MSSGFIFGRLLWKELVYSIFFFLLIRSLLNSPLLRRRKKMSIESSEEDVEIAAGNVSVPSDLTGKDDLNDDEAETEVAPPVGSRGYHNLETFQRKKLKQKVKIKSNPVI